MKRPSVLATHFMGSMRVMIHGGRFGGFRGNRVSSETNFSVLLIKCLRVCKSIQTGERLGLDSADALASVIFNKLGR